jgi:hypothetical protein
MADILEAAGREAGGTRSILRLIRSSPTTSPETSAMRAELEGLRLAFLPRFAPGRTVRQGTLA